MKFAKPRWSRAGGASLEFLAGPLFVERLVLESRTLGSVAPGVSVKEATFAALSGMGGSDLPFRRTQDAVAADLGRMSDLGVPEARTRPLAEMAKSRDALLGTYWSMGLAASFAFSAGSAAEDLIAIEAERLSSLEGKITSDSVQRLALEDTPKRGTVTWVDENASMSETARDYGAGAEGARSNLSTRAPQAPAIDRTTPTGSAQVRFDGSRSRMAL
jgi:hypothetical protein